MCTQMECIYIYKFVLLPVGIIVTNKISDHYITVIGKKVISKYIYEKREIIDNTFVYTKHKLATWDTLLHTVCPSELYYKIKNVFFYIYASTKIEKSIENNVRHKNLWVTEEIKHWNK